MVADSGATSSCGWVSDPFITTRKPSTKTFHTLFGQVLQTIEAAQLHIQVREPAQTVAIVTGLQQTSLLSISRFAEANYFAVFTPEEIQKSDWEQVTIVSSMGPILRGWREPKTGL